MVWQNKVTKSIDKITYSVSSPKDFIKQSVVKVITPEIYDRYGFPVEGGLMDLRMGVIEPGLSCKTCNQSYKNCEGHFGHLELARPILNVLFIDDIYKVLKATCTECFRVLVADDKREETLNGLDKQKEELGSEKFVKAHNKFVSAL